MLKGLIFLEKRWNRYLQVMCKISHCVPKIYEVFEIECWRSWADILFITIFGQMFKLKNEEIPSNIRYQTFVAVCTFIYGSKILHCTPSEVLAFYVYLSIIITLTCILQISVMNLS